MKVLSQSFAKASEDEIFTCVRRRYLTSFAGFHFENWPRLTELDAAEHRQKTENSRNTAAL